MIFIAFIARHVAGEEWAPPEGDALRLTVWGWQPEDPGSPDVDGAVDRCLGELAEAAGIPVAPKAVSTPFLIESSAYKVSIQEYWNKYPSVKVGFDGTSYLVVWMQQEKPFKDEFNHRLVGVRISQACKALDATSIDIESTPCAGCDPDRVDTQSSMPCRTWPSPARAFSWSTGPGGSAEARPGCGKVRLAGVRVTPGAVWSAPAVCKNGPKKVREAAVVFGSKNGLVVFSNWDDSSPDSADHAAQIVGVLIDRSS